MWWYILRRCILDLRVEVFTENMAIDALKYSSAPGPFGDRGDTLRWGLMAGSAAWRTPYLRCCPFFPVQRQPTELPATTEGRWRRRHLSPGHKAGLLTVLLMCTGCAFQVTPGVDKGVTLFKGDQPKNWRVPPQKLDARLGHPCSPFFNLVDGILVLFGAFMPSRLSSHPSFPRVFTASSLSLDLELRVHGVCPLLARHRLAIWRVAVSRPWCAPYFLSLHCSGFNFFLDSLMSH